uniref:Uncharacterized protein n=1 Tax=Cryptomonas curvata TaxID=233186 RepID=A0A7S0LWQ0_9CRYP
MFRNNQQWFDLWVVYLIECVWKEISVRTSIFLPSAKDTDLVVQYDARPESETSVCAFDQTAISYSEHEMCEPTSSEHDFKLNGSSSNKSECLEWIISRVETPQQASPYHVPTELFPSDNQCQTSSGLLVAITATENSGNFNSGLIPVRSNLPVVPFMPKSMPKLNLVGITDTETKPEIVTARSGFLTAREPSPVIIGTIEPSPSNRAEDAATP